MKSPASIHLGRSSMLLAAPLLLIAGALAGRAAASEPRVAYRRVLVPADSPASWPRGEKAYLPVESSDFDAWIADAQAPPSVATIVEAEYEARLEADQLAAGRGRWRVELRGNRPANLPLGDTSLRIHDARWHGGSDELARLGWWPRGSSGELVHALEVPRSGELKFNWSVEPTTLVVGALEIPLCLPAAARTQLDLELPAGKRPVIDEGVVLQSRSPLESGERWRLALNGSAEKVLRIEGTEPESPAPAFTTAVAEQLRYAASPRGMELTAKLALDAVDDGLRELSVALPKGYQLVAATADGRDLKWHATPVATSGGAPRTVIELPTSRPNRASVIELKAWGDLAIDERTRLPSVAVDQSFWRSADIAVAIDESLELNEVIPVDCIQIAAASGETPRDARRQLNFAAYAPSAAVQVRLAHREAVGHLRMGTSVEVGGLSIAARHVVRVRVDQGRLSRLTAQLRSNWTIDAVETIPADALGEWYLDRTDKTQVVELRLNRAVTPQHGVTVVVSGRLPRAASLEPLPIADLYPLQWRGMCLDRHLLQLRAAEQHELETVGDLPEIAAEALAPAERKLFVQPAGGRLCDLATSAPAAAVRLAPIKGAYEATVQLAAELSHGRLRQSYRVECRPQGSGIDHVLVYWSPPAAQSLRWFDAESHEPIVAERMPDDDPRLRGLPPGGELWQLNLSRLYARTLTLETGWSEPWSELRRVPLISLPDAKVQQGRVAVASGGELPTIVARRMSPTPLPIDPSDDLPSDPAVATCAVYRFQPTRLYDGAPAPELWLGPATAAPAGDSLLATEVAIESRYSRDGAGAHRVTCQLENRGEREVKFSLPNGFALQAARVDGRPVPGPHRSEIAISLSSRQPRPVLELEISSQGAPLASGSRLPVPLPSGTWSMLAGRWTIELPNGYAAIDGSRAAADAAFTWRKRLFGPLARPAGRQIFNPLSAANWNAMWVAISGPLVTPVQAADNSAPGEPSLPTPWRGYEFRFAVEPPAEITVVHLPATTAGALGIGLTCAVVASLVAARARVLIVWAALAAAIALFVPAVVAPLATAAGLGFAAAAFWRWWHWRIGLRPSTLAAALAALALLPTAAEADEPPRTIEQVFVPVDAQGQAVGTKYFVSADFLRRLVASASSQSVNRTWLIRDMHCDGELLPRQQNSQLGVGNWVVTFEIETSARDTTLTLPLVKREADWSETASLDGMPTRITWNAAGNECSLRVAEPGRGRLSFALVPQVTQLAGRKQVELNLPPVAGAEVRIVGPAGLAALQGLGTELTRHDEQNRAVWRGKLGASGRLAVNWLPDLADSLADAGRRVDQLLWLHLQPEGVTLDVRLALHGAADWPESIALAVGRDWEFIDGTVAAASDDANELPDGRRLLRFRVPATQSAATGDNDRQLALRFRARDSSPFGRWRVPAISLASAHADNGWLAVSCDPALDCVPSTATTAAAGPIASLAYASGAGDVFAPQLLLNSANLDAAWYLSVKPRGGVSACRDRMALAAGANRLRIDYTSEITPQGADRFGWSLAVPAALEVHHVSVTCGDRTVAVDSVRVESDRLNLFFAEEIAQPYQLHLRANLPAEPQGGWPLPRITPAGPQQTTQTVALYRDPDVLASWQFSGETPWVESGASQDAPFGPAAQFVHAYAIESPSTDAARIRVVPNAPVVNGDTLTTVSCDDGLWTATYRCDLRVAGGVLDALRWEIPASWTGPFQVSPAGQSPVVTHAEAGRTAQLILRLPQSAHPGDVVRWELRSPLTFAEGEPPAAPQIALQIPGSRRDFLALPATLDGQPAEWSRGGVAPAELPRKLRAAPEDGRAAVTYRRLADAIDVDLRQRTTRSAAAHIPLVETATQCDAAGGMFAVTRFLIAPEGLDQCVIELAANDRLVQTALDGQPALIRALDERRWQVQLGPPNLPQLLDVVTRAARPDRFVQNQVELRRPALTQSGQPIPVDLGLWSVAGLPQEGTPQVSGGAAMTAADFAATRLEQLANISQNATRPVLDSPASDGRNWFRRWSERLAAARRTADRLQLSPTGTRAATQVPQSADTSLGETIARCDHWTQQIAEVFAAKESDGTLSAPPENSGLDPWLDRNAESQRHIYLVADGGQDRVLVESAPDGLSAPAARFVALAALATVALGAIWLLRNPPAMALVERWPEAVGAAVGLAAWAWLWPSALGLAVAVVSLGFVVRHLARERKSPGHGSSHQPTSIPEDAAKL